MESLDHLLALAKEDGAQTLILEDGKSASWDGMDGTVSRGPEWSHEQLAQLLLQLVPEQLQVSLAIGEPVLFECECIGKIWAFAVENSEQRVRVQIDQLPSPDESIPELSYEDYVELDAESDGIPDGMPEIGVTPPFGSAIFGDSTQSGSWVSGKPDELEITSELGKGVKDSSKDDPILAFAASKSVTPALGTVFPPIEDHPSKSSNPASAQNTYDASIHASDSASSPGELASNAGVPHYIEDNLYDSTRPAPLDQEPWSDSTSGDGGSGVLLLAGSTAVAQAIISACGRPCMEVGDDDHVSTVVETVRQLGGDVGICIDAEDPSQWFTWAMRRLEEHRLVIVACRAKTELGALRVLCGLHPEVPCARWLAEHPRYFLTSVEQVEDLFNDSAATVIRAMG